jgi:hypothetical protein
MDNTIIEESDQEKPSITKAVSKILLFIISIIICGFCIFLIREEVVFFFRGEPVDLGDIRERYAKGEREVALEHNSYVKFSNGLGLVKFRTRPDDSFDRRYFYCPIFNLLVQTKQELPKKPSSTVVEIKEGLADLIYSHKVSAEEFAVSFSGEGRVMDQEWFMKHFPTVYKFYKDLIGNEKMYFFDDGATPNSFIPYILALIIALSGISYSCYRLVKTILIFRRL